MPDTLSLGTTSSHWMSLLATGVGLLALMFGIAGYVARWLDRRGARHEFTTEDGRHDWRGRRRRE